MEELTMAMEELQINNNRIAGILSRYPKFHFPDGIPLTKDQNDMCLSAVARSFLKNPNHKIPRKDFVNITQAMGFPRFTQNAIYKAICQCAELNFKESPEISFLQFGKFWKLLTEDCHDLFSRFIFTLSVARSGLPARKYLEKEDFHIVINDILENHPGLSFLKNDNRFHFHYVQAVVARIFWEVNRSWTGRIMYQELKKSNFMKDLEELEELESFAPLKNYFSYVHFYVIYCNFWELDVNHDMVISKDDFKLFDDGAVPDEVIDRIFSGIPLRLRKSRDSKETMSFEEFVYYLLAEEDKRHPASIEYWFRCLDLDGDGIISIYEMELFYKGMMKKLMNKSFEAREFNDVICQLLDLVAPKDGKITLRDIKCCGLPHRFFNTFVNVFKFINQENTDGEKSMVKPNGEKEASEWEKFCESEYKILVASNIENAINDSF